MEVEDRSIRIHYHIKWDGAGKLDWEAFKTKEQADQRALELARTGEKYDIEERDDSCERCKQQTAWAS